MNLKKIVIAFVATLFASASFVFAGSSVYASESNNDAQEAILSEQEMKEQAVQSLKFYLEDAGYIDPVTHQYIPTDLAALKEKAELPGAEGQSGKFIYENFVIPALGDDLQKYAACVVINSLPFGGVIWDILEGENIMQTLINYLQGANYDKAVDILLDIAKESLTPSQFAKFNVITIAASVAINAVSCWGN
ncbi:streptococcin A-M57 [Enterococcus canintestini]|nr:streptococcin A-M57 [Enterococcus canintestini]